MEARDADNQALAIKLLEVSDTRLAARINRRVTSPAGAPYFVMPFVPRSLMHKLWDQPTPHR